MRILDDLLTLAENSKIPNTNDIYVEPWNYERTGAEVTRACMVGAMAVEAGVSHSQINNKFSEIEPDKLEVTGPNGGFIYRNLADYINDLNSPQRGRKRLAALVRKHFSKSLNKKII